uniref:Uncharacterized protein n=1 Tax=Euplotes harpa TaxID=151035 RepID=A0A7S3JER0_9SPIT|mmetsp:Transcript_33305/g.38236  ORF Transcript_33305/g.38236 Transcript_33305/m.38236 type:complete len:138 (+) Transcript_33305:55-468(+)
MLLAVSMAKRGDPIPHRGQELIDWIEGGIKGTFIVFFYDQNASVGKTSQVRQEVKTTILDKYPDFHYYEVDVEDQDFAELVKKFEIDEKQLTHAPTVLVASDGKGFWAHGQGAVSEVAYNLPKYSSDLRVPDKPAGQ